MFFNPIQSSVTIDSAMNINVAFIDIKELLFIMKGSVVQDLSLLL